MYNFDSFFWYDLETFGLNPSYDRIAQFAGQRTDLNLNPIGDPVVLYCRLSADYLPDPQSIMVTGITPQEVKKKGIPEAVFIEKINKMFSEKGTVVCGFNSLKFDDEFIRNALYRNFMDPYEREWENNCSRWDILDLVRACHDLRPQGIKWPSPKENGNPSFKLTDMTAANNIDQTGAHDAMVDVNATIAVARLIKEKQPKLFDYYLSLRNKAEVKNILNLQDLPRPLIHTCANFTTPNGCSSLIVAISPKVNQDNSILCFDLSKDPTPLIVQKEGESVYMTPGLFRLATNRSPFICEMNTIKDEDYARLGIDKNLCMAHYNTIMDCLPSIIQNLRNNEESFPKPEDPDMAIYNGFFSDYDKSLFEVVRKTPPEQRMNLNLDFKDSRCNTMLWRHVCRNYPELLTGEELKKWKDFSATRIVCPPGGVQTDLDFVQRKIVEHLEKNETTDKQKEVLHQLQDYVDSLKKYLNLK